MTFFHLFVFLNGIDIDRTQLSDLVFYLIQLFFQCTSLRYLLHPVGCSLHRCDFIFIPNIIDLRFLILLQLIQLASQTVTLLIQTIQMLRQFITAGKELAMCALQLFFSCLIGAEDLLQFFFLYLSCRHGLLD